MLTYTKVFNTILDSTIWYEQPLLRLLWCVMLIKADQHGKVYSSILELAAKSGLTVPECEAALEKFASPDPYSRSKEFEGRRVQYLVDEGAWLVLNHAKYRALGSTAESRAHAAERQRRFYKKHKKAKVETVVIADDPPVAKKTRSRA